ncbi:putative N-acetylglucosaminyl-phosphatidylinositol de-N-acetylase [Spathaspora sp. JA1]|nr:putative N-acetylglucosaminyl-phosphatidylinositol de-N-acetylase [Spathaspora sp. JA1]
MFFTIPKAMFRIFISSFIIWLFLTTILPQATTKYSNNQVRTNKFKSQYPYNSITSPTPLPIANSSVYFIIAHPDDEVMFFSPSVVEISKSKYNNTVNLICFSPGDAVDQSMGTIRRNELYDSSRILGIQNVTVLNYRDGMNETWSLSDIRQSLTENIINPDQSTVLITFDQGGVSSHANHISLYHGTKNYIKKRNDNSTRLLVLKSVNFWEKYSFTLLTDVELFVDHLSSFISKVINLNINVSFFTATPATSIKIYSDLNMLSVSYAAMCYGHFSQMVWFRYGWLLLSRYLTFNHLIEL